MLSSGRKNFFYLVGDDNFSFEKDNFFKNCWDIDIQISSSNDLQRNLNGNLLNLDANKEEKLSFIVKGYGKLFLDNTKKTFFLISSVLSMPYSNDNKRKIMFDYLFDLKKGIPFTNQNSNLQQLANQNDMFFVPIIPVYIKNLKVQNNSKNNPDWILELEEI